MYFRCPACLAATWQDDERPIQALAELSCGCCAKVLRVRPSPALGKSAAERFRAMLHTAEELGVDAASAYSVLLGLLTLDQLHAASSDPERWRGVEAPAPAAAPRARPHPVAKSVETSYDPGFRAAVLSGRLTVHEAVQRGDHDAFVASLVNRHALSHELASRVADNRVSLHQALAARAVKPRAPKPEPRRGARRFASGLVVAVTLATLGLLSYWANVRWESSFPPPSRPKRGQAPRVSLSQPPERGEAPTPRVTRLAATAVRRDAAGQVIEILGPDPAAVLTAFCEARGDRGGLEPLEITETVPRLVDARLGLYRDPAVLEWTQAIWMRKDHRSRRWIAGDGKHPIPVRRAPEFPVDARREPVEYTPPDPSGVAAQPPPEPLECSEAGEACSQAASPAPDQEIEVLAERLGSETSAVPID